jgi:hypothetical protein
MGGVFISYRREESVYALLLYHRLTREFGAEQVFRDIERISPGEDFVTRLDQEIRKSQAMAVLIGKGWLRLRSSLSKPEDFMRREVLLALKERLAVFPVLVGGAGMPSARQLPRCLSAFARVNAIPVTDYRFDSVLDTLVGALGSKLGPMARPSPPEALFFLTLTAPATQALIQKVDQLQIHALELIERGDVAGAQRKLLAGWGMLMDLRSRGAPGPPFDVRLGYVCKTLAQAFDEAGDHQNADHYMSLAASAFSSVERQPTGNVASAVDIAGALNGLGNVHSYRGESDEAIACYRRAVAILPDYAYAWHDLFLEYLTRAQRGRVDLDALREALSRLKQTGLHVEGVGPERIAQFERELARLEHAQ